jgi:hypothetical protein
MTLNTGILSIIMLNVFMLSVGMLIVVVPLTSIRACKLSLKLIYTDIFFTKPLSIATCNKRPVLGATTLSITALNRTFN